MGKGSPSLASVAKAAGVSRMTASRALRDAYGIAPTTRERVRAAAARLGYRSNPTLSRVMTSLRRGRGTFYAPSIAYINFWPDRPPFSGNEDLALLHDGARRRAEELGARFEVLSMLRPKLSGARAAAILRARGIDALIFGPPAEGQTTTDLDPEGFAVAALGAGLQTPRLNRVLSDQSGIMRLALAQARRRGYRRIGFCAPEHYDARTNHHFFSRYAYYATYEADPADAVPALRLPELTPAAVSAWIKRHRIEAVLAPYDLTAELRGLGWTIPEQLGFILLNRMPRHRCSGVDQRYSHASGASVDLALMGLWSGEFGVPATSRGLLVEPLWCEGDSLRPVP